jgi:hypothetical protein
MQDLPNKVTLLEALAHFLETQVRPALKDPSLAFRARIAAHLAEAVAREVKSDEAQDLAELARLQTLLGQQEASPPRSSEQRKGAILLLNRELSKRLRKGDLDERTMTEARAHVKATLIEKLKVTQPRFDTSLEIE